MVLRSKRHRLLFGLSLGFLISFLLSGTGFLYYLKYESVFAQEKIAQIKEAAINEYFEKNPVSPIYVFSKDKRAGEVINDGDLVSAEISTVYMPEDAVRDLKDAVGKVIRCDVREKTCVTYSLIYEEENYPDDLRQMEYTVINLPEKLEPNQYIDIRIMFPNGLDYIVLTKKRVLDLKTSDDGRPVTVWLQAQEEEILRMDSAVVDASLVEGAFIYAVPYVAPDVQKEAQKTYPVNSEVQSLIANNPNIVEKAVTELEKRNRGFLEELINQKLQNTGQNKVFYKSSAMAPTVDNAAEAGQNEQPGYGMDGRL